jgi:hypothetical protein
MMIERILKVSHPFESAKNGVGVADNFSIVKDKSVILSVVGWYVDGFIFS